MSDFLSMGGYWAFVWPAYGVAAIVLIGLLVSTLRSLRNAEAALAALERERPRRTSRAPLQPATARAADDT